MTDKYVEKSKIFAQMILYGFRAPDMTVTEFVDDLPATDVEKVRHGYWVQPNPLYNPFCSECKKYEQSGEKKKYCSECGAKMDGKENDE